MGKFFLSIIKMAVFKISKESNPPETALCSFHSEFEILEMSIIEHYFLTVTVAKWLVIWNWQYEINLFRGQNLEKAAIFFLYSFLPSKVEILKTSFSSQQLKCHSNCESQPISWSRVQTPENAFLYRSYPSSHSRKLKY